MKERPILFSGPMVRAILEGRKTQTRRIIKPQPKGIWESGFARPGNLLGIRSDAFSVHCNINGDHRFLYCPCGQAGDRLLVASEIPGIPDTYCASSDGVIYSRARDRSKWVPLKPWRQEKGYQTVTIMDGKRKRSLTVHSLVCSAFYGTGSKGMQVRHLDGNPENGLPENLAWGTQAENWVDRKAHGNGCEGEKHHAAKLSDEERAHVRWAIENGLSSQRATARALGMSQAAIHQIVRGCELRRVGQEIPADRIPRITLEITSVRVERLQEITEEDALNEGVEIWAREKLTTGERWENQRMNFAMLWESINGDGSWEANPWVWVIEFRRLT